MKKTLYLTIFLIILLLIGFSFNTAAFSNEHANFSIVYDNLKIPLKTFSVFVMPREEIKFYIAEEDRGQIYQIELGGKTFESNSSFTWQAQAESGHYQATIRKKNNGGSDSEIKINVFVLHSYQDHLTLLQVQLNGLII